MARMTGLILPRHLPDGSISYEEARPDIGERIRDGDATLGWLGDPLLTLVCTPTFESGGVPRWEVWRKHPEGEPSLVASKVGTLEADQLIRMLAAHDTRTHDVVGELLARNDARTEASKAAFREGNEERADKLAWALGRDLGIPAQDGRPYG
jgi:hypothetical protein